MVASTKTGRGRLIHMRTGRASEDLSAVRVTPPPIWVTSGCDRFDIGHRPRGGPKQRSMTELDPSVPLQDDDGNEKLPSIAPGRN